MQRMTLGISAAVLILAGTAFAQDQRPAPQAETRAEAQDSAGRLFDKLDLNHDGKLDQADRAARLNQMFDRIDSNHDGMISRDEFAASHAHEGGPDHGPGHPGGGSGMGGPGMGGPGMGGPGMEGGHPRGPMGHWGYDRPELDGLVMLILHRADPGHTGTVTRAGFIAAALSLFDQADTNHDGILTPEEHRAAAQAMRQQMRADWQHRGGPGDMPPPPPPGN